MEHQIRRQRRALDRPRLPRHVAEREPCRDVAQIDREERRRERVRDAVAEARDRRRRAPNVYRNALVPKRREEPEPLEVVEVQMGEQEVDPPCAPCPELGAEAGDLLPAKDHASGRGRVQAALRVEHVLAPGLVEAERDVVRRPAQRLLAGPAEAPRPQEARPGRHREPVVAPDGQAHRLTRYSRQKIATIPTNSSACAKGGNAVTATVRSTPSVLVTW